MRFPFLLFVFSVCLYGDGITAGTAVNDAISSLSFCSGPSVSGFSDTFKQVSSCSTSVFGTTYTGTAIADMLPFDARAYGEIAVGAGNQNVHDGMAVHAGTDFAYSLVNSFNSDYTFTGGFTVLGNISQTDTNGIFAWSTLGRGIVGALGPQGNVISSQVCTFLNETSDSCSFSGTVPANGILTIELIMSIDASFTENVGPVGAFDGIVDFGRSTSLTGLQLRDASGNVVNPNSVFLGVGSIPTFATPEPSTAALMVLPLLLGGLRVLRRDKALSASRS